MKHAIDPLRDALPVVVTLPGEELVHIQIDVRICARIKVPVRKVADNPATKNLYERGVMESRLFDDTECTIAQTRH